MENIEKIITTIDEFRQLVVSVNGLYAQYKAEVQEAEDAFLDIRHYCELSYPTNRKDRTKVCRLLKEYGDRRRTAKDMLSVLQPLYDAVNQSSRKSSKDIDISIIGKIANDTQKAYKHLNGRAYRPRLLEELFKTEEV